MEIENSDLRQIQKVTLDLLGKFITICEKYELTYYITGGTLIGVKRHQGFIPWDDDIDIAMPRRDFDKFHKIITNNMPDDCSICNSQNEKNWNFAFSQFLDKEYVVEIKMAEKIRKSNIWIDIYPLDGLPNNIISRWIKVKYILFYRYFIQLGCISTQVDMNRNRVWYEKAILGFCKLINTEKYINTKKLVEKLNNILNKNAFDDAEFVGNMLGRYREKEVVPKEYFGIPQKSIFEGILVDIPEKSHLLLTQLYGDYMKLPADNERTNHNIKLIKKDNDN